MGTVFLVLGGLAVALVVIQRQIWLVGTSIGWVVFIANVVGEVGPKRLGVKRGFFEAVIGFVGAILLLLGGLDHLLLFLAIALMLVSELVVSKAERRLLDAVWAKEDRIGPTPKSAPGARGLAKGYPAPSTHPSLTVNLVGPFVTRRPACSLGTLVVGRRVRLVVLVANHALTPTQTGVRLEVTVPAGMVLHGPVERMTPILQPGAAGQLILDLEAVSASSKTFLELTLTWGETVRRERVWCDRIVETGPPIASAVIRRYPGGARAAFAWRGDMDLYDTSTFQSIEGLEATLGLAARYRMPQTMYLSTRLSLDLEEARRFTSHYGVDRGAERIPVFLDWVRTRVDLRHRAGYPFESDRPFLMELGNHGHLHYGTDASAAEENNWAPKARMGAGVYPWAAEASNSFEEQRDNALETRRRMEQEFDFSPKSWAMPDRTRDEHTPRAMEAAGCEVLSDSDVRTRDNVLFQPRPHFAPNSGAVELTKRYPGDPMNILQYAMNLFWMHRAHRLGIPVIFMCHQHMRLYEGWACTRFTEAVLRYVLERFNGDFWINTVYGIGVYWRDLLSEKKKMSLVLADGQVLVRYTGSMDHAAVPVDLRFADGGRATILVDLNPDMDVVLDSRGPLS